MSTHQHKSDPIEDEVKRLEAASQGIDRLRDLVSFAKTDCTPVAIGTFVRRHLPALAALVDQLTRGVES